MRPDFVVIAPPLLDFASCLIQRSEPLHIQAFVPKLAVETFNIAILHGLARLDEVVPNPMLLHPIQQRFAGEFWSIVRSNRLGIASKVGGLIQHPRHISTADSVIDDQINAFVAEVIRNRENLDSATRRQAIADKI